MIARTLLLKASESAWLRERATRTAFVRRAVSRFMPGETFDDMMGAARALVPDGIAAVFTRLGENVRDLGEASAVTDHYLDALGRVQHARLACEPSIKLTQLGLDIDRERGYSNARAIAARAREAGLYLWVDIEQSPYVDVTLDITERLRREFPDVGVCLQAYLYRTAADLDRMITLGAGVRLVKGAYKEPPDVAWPRKADVDVNYLRLARRMLESRMARPVFGTHDTAIIGQICAAARALDVAPRAYEFHMLYGIQRAEQLRLARAGEGVRVLIAYGTYWFPWYMRRLAERPANVWFVVRSVFAG